MIGKHAIFDASNVTVDLSYLQNVRKIVHEIANRCDLHVVNEVGHQFDPHGVTYVLVLSESHLSIHTYPETERAYIDIFCCNQDFDISAALKVVKDVLGTDHVEWKSSFR